jgi:copper transport protein
VLEIFGVGLSLDRCRSMKAATALCLILSPLVGYTSVGALLHATLLRSSPAANSRLAQPPETIRLVFSEPVVPALSQISLIDSGGKAQPLHVTGDPRNVRILVGRVGPIPSGQYKVSWRILSADGHPILGTFSFFVESATAGMLAPTGTSTAQVSPDSATRDTLSASSPTPPTTETRTPVLASVLRGAGLGSLMAGLGLLFFGVTAGERRKLVPRVVVVRLIGIGAILLVGHMFAWLFDISPDRSLSGSFIGSVLGSTVGQIEMLRVVLAVLSLWAIALARRDALALALGGACLLVSGAVGHPAAIQPFVSIPAKMAHLLSAALWLGGLLWLVWLSRCDEIACRTEARRVSSVALVAVIAIFLTGSLETFLFLNSPSDLIHSDYGRLVLLKVLGLTLLVGAGAYNRFGLIPRLDESGATSKLSRSVSNEIVIVTIVILIGGFLAYVPIPPTPQSSLSALTGRSR